MAGCEFEQKSFTVGGYNKTKDICEECKAEIEGTIYKINKKKLCKQCWDKHE